MASRSRSTGEAGGYVAAVAATAVAAVLRLALSSGIGDQAPCFAFGLAVLVAAWYAGLKPGLLATALGAVLGLCLFVPPHYSLRIDSAGRATIPALFLIIGVAASWVCEGLHAARRRT